jgi:hypothetical protein
LIPLDTLVLMIFSVTSRRFMMAPELVEKI